MAFNNISVKSESLLFAETIIDFFNFKKNGGDKLNLDKICQELVDLHARCKSYLDRKFLTEIITKEPSKIYSGLWEIIVVNSLYD